MHLLQPILELSNKLILILIGIIGIGFIIGFHELGHFLFGKLFKIETPAFAVGFGPKIYKKKIGETNFSIGIIPLGGYVESDKKSFESKPYWQKMCVFGSGILFNLLFAYIAFCLLFALGLPKTRFLYPINTVPLIAIKDESIGQKDLDKTKAQANSQSQDQSKSATEKQEPTYDVTQLKLENNDKIIAINGKSISNKPSIFYEKIIEIKNIITTQAIKTGQEAKEQAAISGAPASLVLTIERNNTIQDLTIEVKPFIDALEKMQISFQYAEPNGLPLLESIKSGINFTNKYIKLTLYMFKNMIVKRDASSLGGPIAIISETAKSAGQGFKIFLILLAFISVSLAILNLIPLPILDGGQALLCTIEAVCKRELSEKAKEVIFMISWGFMLLLFVLVSARDIWTIVKTFIIKK